MFRKIDEHISVAGQILPAHVAEAARQGFVAIVNNRPDGEEPGQPEASAIAEAAAAAGLAYSAIPIEPGRLGGDQIEAMQAVLTSASGPVLAFCRSGTRSTHLWGLTRARMGDEADTIIAKAADAGYDLEPMRDVLRMTTTIG